MSRLEWNYLLSFGGGIIIWMLYGVPLLNSAVITYGVIPIYTFFLFVYTLLFYLFGNGLSKKDALRFAIMFISLFLFMDIWSPPILIPLSGSTQLSPEQSLASDVYFYMIFTQIFKFPHSIAWLLTYIFMPVVFLFVLSYALTRKKLHEIIFR